MDKELLLSNPKGFCTEKYIRIHYPDEYNNVLQRPGNKFSERLYNYLYGCPSHTCPICGKETKFKQITTGYARCCSVACSYKDLLKLEKAKQTCKEKYGVDNPSQSDIIKERKKTTCQEHYGVDSYYKTKECQDKSKQAILQNKEEISLKKKQTKLKHFGDENFNNQVKTKQTKLERYGDEKYNNRNKASQTYQEHYGVDNVFKSDEFKEHLKQHNLEQYGVEYYNQTQECKDKKKQTCLDRYGVTNSYQIPIIKEKCINKIYDKFKQNNPLVLSIQGEDYICSCPHMSCTKCDSKIFVIDRSLYNNRVCKKLELCTILHPIEEFFKNTTIEIKIKEVLDKYGVEYTCNDRTIISPQELDIYIPSHKIAIECNGNYWHSRLDSNYHYNKFIKCQEKGIQLISLWEDQILQDIDKIENIITSKLGIYDKRVYARNCEIQNIDQQTLDTFLNKYHLQGSCIGCSVRLGLYYNDELLSVMCFGKGRKCLHSQDEIELYRYCCKEKTQVIGGAGRLFNYFVKHYHPKSIISFSSNDISNGSLYKNLGFNKESYSIGYWYTKGGKRYHRYNFTKQKLIKMGFDSSKTESQIMQEQGYSKIYDSGQTKWVYYIEE